MGIQNLGTPQVANRAIVQLAIEAGIVDLIKSLVAVATDKRSLLLQIVDTLGDAVEGKSVHPALNTQFFAEVLEKASADDLIVAFNMDVLDKVLEYIDSDSDSAVVSVKSLPRTIPVDGPAETSVVRDRDTVEITFSEPPVDWAYEIYVDLKYVGKGAQATATVVDGLVTHSLVMPFDGETHTVRVLFVDPSGSMTRFGPVATFT